jgi:serine/threonine protein phosphatase PrpC
MVNTTDVHSKMNNARLPSGHCSTRTSDFFNTHVFNLIIFRVEDNCFLYGVFDGHDGSKASNFAAQRMPAELLLGQLAGKNTDDEIHENLRQVSPPQKNNETEELQYSGTAA